MTNLTLYSWNINGIRAATKKGLFDWVKQTSLDILCLQETKADESQLTFDIKFIDGFTSLFANCQSKKGYSGVATYTKIAPSHHSCNIGIESFDREGRILITEYEKFTLFNVYFPNGKASPERLDYKMKFYDAFLEYIENYRKKGKSVIFCGDVNTAHKPIDLARPKENEDISGFLPQEREWMDKVISIGFIDTFRFINPEKIVYSWWSQRSGARARNVGWRIDYFFVSPDLRNNIVSADIHPEVMGSDHCPISLILSL